MSNAITRRSKNIPIFQGDDVLLIEELDAEYRRVEALRNLAENQKRIRLADPSPSADANEALLAAAKAYDDAVAEALPRAVMATVTAVGRKTWRRLLAEHPPREDNEGDEALGFNEDEFPDALLEHFDAETGERSITAPEFNSKAAVTAWLDELSDGVFMEIWTTAVRLNQGGSPDPKASLESQVERMYVETSRSPDSTE